MRQPSVKELIDGLPAEIQSLAKELAVLRQRSLQPGLIENLSAEERSRFTQLQTDLQPHTHDIMVAVGRSGSFWRTKSKAGTDDEEVLRIMIKEIRWFF